MNENAYPTAPGTDVAACARRARRVACMSPVAPVVGVGAGASVGATGGGGASDAAA